jgi:acyl-coenzyme A synthetase/AMP-(fatty) acid ligase
VPKYIKHNPDIAQAAPTETRSIKAPKAVHVFASIPKSPVGKVLKNIVRETIVEQSRRD